MIEELGEAPAGSGAEHQGACALAPPLHRNSFHPRFQLIKEEGAAIARVSPAVSGGAQNFKMRPPSRGRQCAETQLGCGIGRRPLRVGQAQGAETLQGFPCYFSMDSRGIVFPAVSFMNGSAPQTSEIKMGH